MHPQDFKDIEQTVMKRFEESFKNVDPKLTITIAKISARIAAMAIQEYHRKLQLKNGQSN